MKKITTIIMLCITLLGYYGCDNPVKDSNHNSSQDNTLNDSSLNDHFIGSSSEYFYDFERNIDVKFYRWDISAINQPILFNPDTDTLNFRTFPEFLLNIAPGEIGEPFTDLNNNGLYDPGEPFEDQGNGLWDLGEPFTDTNSNGFYDAGEPYDDINEDGQWNGTEHLYDVNGDCTWNDAETFDDWDENGEWTPAEPLFNEYINIGQWDPHEPFEDLNGNGQYDPVEPYTDVNLDGEWTTHEPFTDLDGDGEWDAAETYVEKYDNTFYQPFPGCNCEEYEIFPGLNGYRYCGSPTEFDQDCGDTFSDLNGNGVYDPEEEPYEDIYYPYGQFNPDEPFTDLNGDGVWTDAEPFTNLNTNAPGDPVWNDDEGFTDWDGNGVWTPAEPLLSEYFVNGVWDDAELFDDLNGNGVWDNQGEQFEDMNGDCLWSVGESFIDRPDDPSVAEWNSYTDKNLILNETIVKNTPVEIVSSQIRHLNQMYWDFDLERYTSVVSDWDGMDTTIVFSDPYDSLIYQQPVVSLPSGNNSYYVDRSEWIGTSYIYTSGDSTFSTTFHMKQKVVGPDSLMFHRHADCNLNGIADPAEPWTDLNDNGVVDDGEYEDLGNGVLDAAEPFYDRDQPGESGYGVYDPDEPFMDLNCNGVWDPAETEDTGNGIWDDAEPPELFYRTLEPNNLVVSFDNYPDLSNPRILLTINSEEWFPDCGIDNICPDDPDWEEADEGEGNGILDPGEDFEDFNGNGTCCDPADSVITYDGRMVSEVIKVEHFDNIRTKEIANIDSLVTIYSNDIIENMEINPDDNNYYITKTRWLSEDPANPGSISENYDYHIFKENNNIYQLVHPSYFLPPGFWNNSQSDPPLEDGFWFENFTVDEVLYYTPGGNFRDGEYVYRDTTVSTNIGNYYIEKSFSVAIDDVIVPARKILGYVNDNNDVICYENESLEGINSISDCPKDTSFTDVFKITNLIEMTMIGPGIKYGEKTIMWLAKNRGLVKEQVFIRWNGAPWETSTEWIEYSKLELADYRNVDSQSPDGLMRNLLGQVKSVNLNNFGNEGDMDNEPYQVRRTAGFQRVSLPSNND